MPPASLPSVHRVLIVRLSALGDLVFATTLLHGLKAAYPGATVDWLVQPEFADLLRSQPAVDAVHSWDRKSWSALFKGWKWLTLWRAVRAFSATLKVDDYDLVIDAQGLAKSRLLAWLAGGRRCVGYASKEPLGGLMHELVVRPPELRPFLDKDIALEHRLLLAHLTGVKGGAPQMQRPVANGVVPGCLVLAPFTTRPQKHWPEAHWSELIRSLAARGLPLAMLGGPADREAAARILAVAGNPISLHNLVGQTRFHEAAAWIADSRALIGVDTGLTHMGIAYDKPTVAIFGSTVPYRGGARAPLTVLWLGLSCSPCHRKPTCGGRFDCLVDLSPATVLRAFDDLGAAA